MNKRKRKNKIKLAPVIIGAVLILIIITGGLITIAKYSPTSETMSLEEYYTLDSEIETAIVINGKYEYDEKDIEDAIHGNEEVFLNISFLKSNIDDRYVYDKEEGILRFVFDNQVISTSLNSTKYTQGREINEFDSDIIFENNGQIYININFIRQFSDFNYTYESSPSRVSIETAGSVKKMAQLNKDTSIRRFGGPKSKILKQGVKGEQVQIIENYGKWSLVLTEDCVLGCVRNRHISSAEEVSVASNIQEQSFEHNLMDEPVVMGWHQVYSPATSLSTMDSLVSKARGMNVISPTFFFIRDNLGNIHDVSSREYSAKAHEKGLKVWGVVTNVEYEDVDTTTVLNKTSSRDNLVNSLIAAAIASNLDGINVDLEALSIDAKDGYIQFIKELSIKCKNNGIILSVDNHKPEEYNLFYNMSEQANYADYIILMAYDEHYDGMEKAGSNASVPYVKEGVEDTLKDVPNNQLILALPFYTRAFISSSQGITSQVLTMKETDSFLEKNGGEKSWLPEEEQYYSEFEKDGKTYKVWVEDEESLSRKLSIYKDNNLGGTAFWKLGLEPGAVWDIIFEHVR